MDEPRKLAEFTALLDGWQNDAGTMIELDTEEQVDIAAIVDSSAQPVFRIVIYAIEDES